MEWIGKQAKGMLIDRNSESYHNFYLGCLFYNYVVWNTALYTLKPLQVNFMWHTSLYALYMFYINIKIYKSLANVNG